MDMESITKKVSNNLNLETPKRLRFGGKPVSFSKQLAPASFDSDRSISDEEEEDDNENDAQEDIALEDDVEEENQQEMNDNIPERDASDDSDIQSTDISSSLTSRSTSVETITSMNSNSNTDADAEEDICLETSNSNDNDSDKAAGSIQSESESGIGHGSLSPVAKESQESNKTSRKSFQRSNTCKDPLSMLTALSRPVAIEGGLLAINDDNYFLVTWQNPNEKTFQFYTPVRFLEENFTEFLINFYMDNASFLENSDSESD